MVTLCKYYCICIKKSIDLLANCFAEMPETADISYKPHFLRLLTKVKMLEMRESKFNECRELLEEKAAQLVIYYRQVVLAIINTLFYRKFLWIVWI